MHRHATWLIAAAACSMAAATQAAPESESASELDKKARAAFEEKRFRDAAKLFEEANRRAPFPATQFNAALAWERAGELPRAADAYELALSLDGLDDARTGTASERLSALKKNLGYLVITRPMGASVSVAHVKNAPIPTHVHVTPGSHVIIVRDRTGREQRKEARVFAGETAQIALELPTPEPTRPAPKPAVEAKKDSAPSDGSAQRTWGYVALGGGVVLGAAAAFLGVKTLDALDEYKGSDRRNLDARDRTLRYRTWTNVALAGAVVSGAVGLYLVLDASDERGASGSQLRLKVGYDRSPNLATELTF
jgi:tetratricopeptide (TPR) repeat protein